EKAFEAGYTAEKIWELTKIDIWFLKKLERIFVIKNKLETFSQFADVPKDLLVEAKRTGFSDFQIARFVLKSTQGNMQEDVLAMREYRKSIGVLPVVKKIDTLAAEFPAQTNYLYLTYGGNE